MTWDILIASIWSRTEKLTELLTVLQKQIVPGVSIIVARDNATESIGSKRQRLLEASDADYVSAIDDDDIVSDNYISAITNALHAQPDVVNFRVAYTVDGMPREPVVHSLDKIRGGIKRDGTPGRLIGAFTHLSLMKRDIAMSARFDGDYGEDGRWITAVADTGLVTRESFVNEILYHYMWSTFNHFGMSGPIDDVEPEMPEYSFVRYV